MILVSLQVILFGRGMFLLSASGFCLPMFELIFYIIIY